MAKSFHDIIKGGKLDVDHKGESVTLELPEWLKESTDYLMDSELLTQWAEEHEIIHGLLHAGIQKTIIDLRAKARPSTNSKTGETKSIIDDLVNAQQRVNNFVVEPTKPPGHSKGKTFLKGEESALTSAIEALRIAGMDDDFILTTLGAKFDTVKVQMVLKGLDD
ncbi:MAG: hypothetical protein GY861_11360 [bacterium]|nr:hypothetical protein [bacterium]